MLPTGEEFKTGLPTRRGYYIYVTEACNLRCDYCFVRDKQNQRHLTEEMARRVLAFVTGDAAHLKDIYVHFFGGEPLIRPMTVDYLAGELRTWSKVQGVALRLGITTNGTLLTVANCEMLKRHEVGVQLSLDGSKTGNDVHRQLMGGTQLGLPSAGAFDMVQTRNYMDYFGRGRPNCRMTLTVHNLKYLNQSIRELHDLGFKSFSIIPDADCGTWTPEYLSQYEAEMEKVFDYWARHRDISVNAIEQTMDKLVKKRERRSLCNVGTTIIGITVDGDIYPCHDFAGRFASDPVERAKLVIGNVESGYSTNLRNFENGVAWQDAKSGNGHDCATCWAKWACGKGCPYMNYAHSGEIGIANATFCAATRINASLALRWMSVLDEFKFVDSSRPKRGQAGAPVNGKAGALRVPRVPGRVVDPRLAAPARAGIVQIHAPSGAD